MIVGVVLALMGAAQLAFVVRFMSRPALSGFISGVATPTPAASSGLPELKVEDAASVTGTKLLFYPVFMTKRRTGLSWPCLRNFGTRQFPSWSPR